MKQCSRCKGALRYRQYKKNNKWIFEPYGNFTTESGGIFCSSGCAMVYLQDIERQIKIKKVLQQPLLKVPKNI